MKLTLTLLGRDNWSRPVYEGNDGNLYVDADPRAGCPPKICTKYRNAFDIRCVGFVYIEFHYIACLTCAGAAYNDLQKVSEMLAAVQAHPQVLCQNGVALGVFVAVLTVQLAGIAPSGAAVFLAGPAVLL